MKNSAKNIFAGIVCALSLAACSDEIGFRDSDPTEREGIVLKIPVISQEDFSTGTRALSEGEGVVKDLHLYVFQLQDGQSESDDSKYSIVDEYKGTDITNLTSLSTAYQEITLNLGPGTYRIYLLGNVANYLKSSGTDYNFAGLTTISAIKSLDIPFTEAITLEKGLPMVCMSSIQKSTTDPAVSVGDNESVSITANEVNEGTNLYCDMSFICSKVRYTILFDNTQGSEGIQAGVSAAFGKHVADFSGVSITKVAPHTNLATEATSFTTDLKTLSGSLTQYAYPDEAGYPSITSSDLTTAASDANKCAWQGVAYLPENNVTDSKTTLNFSGSVKASAVGDVIYSISKNYELVPLHSGCTEEGAPSSDANHGIKRGRFYDIALTLSSYEANDIEISEAEWSPVTINMDFVHTFLRLNLTDDQKKNGISVTSTEPAEIAYETDGRGAITLDCEKKQGTEPYLYIDYTSKPGKLLVKVNSDLNLDALQDSDLKSGTPISCYIVAGNIRKEIKVTYDIEPFLTVDPASLSFSWIDKEPMAEDIHFETNLGGVRVFISDENGNVYDQNGNIVNISDDPLETDNTTYGEITSNLLTEEGAKNQVSTIYFENNEEKTTHSNLQLNCEANEVASGKISVQSLKEAPKVVSHHYFLIRTINSYKGNHFDKVVEVSVIPGQGNYRVFFRAINDYQDDGSEFLKGVEAFPSDPWTDWWTKHYVYIYGQEGETGGGLSGDTWRFINTDYSNAPEMNKDNYNPGWYLIELDKNLYSLTDNHKNEKITPGRTLFIFNNSRVGAEIHRCSHHNDPGVPLFNYEDREGWYLYDPTREPYYTVWDDKPAIEDITYVVYTPFKLNGWYRNYGVEIGNSSYDAHANYVISKKFDEGTGLWKCSSTPSNGYYVSTLKFKAPSGDYAKNIILRGVNSNNGKYVFCCDNTGWKEVVPRIYIYNSKNDEYTSWDNAPCMTSVSSPNGSNTDKRWFMYKLPEGYENAYIIIKIPDNQWPGGGGVQINPGKNSGIITINGANGSYSWDGDGDDYFFTTLMGGKNFTPESNKTIYGYFDGTTWHEGRP